METTKLSVNLQVIRQDQRLYAQLRFANDGSTPYALERSLSGLEVPAGRQLFRVADEKGQEVAYVGPMAKMAAPAYPDGFVTLQPGGVLQVLYPFDREYNFDKRPQTYRIQFDVINAQPQGKGLDFLKSDMATFSHP